MPFGNSDAVRFAFSKNDAADMSVNELRSKKQEVIKKLDEVKVAGGIYEIVTFPINEQPTDIIEDFVITLIDSYMIDTQLLAQPEAIGLKVIKEAGVTSNQLLPVELRVVYQSYNNQ